MASENQIDTLIKQLSNKDGQAREKARLTLVDIGKEATLPLTKILTAKDQQTRWEAAKTLVEIADPAAVPALIKTLEDEIFDIRWLAAEALIAIGPACIEPLLQALIGDIKAPFLHESAHHVIKYILNGNPKAFELNDILKPIVRALEGPAPKIEAPGTAQTALEKLKRLQNAG